MPDYKTMYQLLCVAADQALMIYEEQKNDGLAAEVLKSALIQAEEVYIETAEELS